MAILKELKLENGITVNYHRIASINRITNIQKVTEVASYISQEERQREKDGAENVFIHTEFINSDYDDAGLIKEEYERIQKIEPFKNGKEI